MVNITVSTRSYTDPPTDRIYADGCQCWAESYASLGTIWRRTHYGSDTWKQHRAEFESGASAAGKDPKRMPVLVEQFVVVGDENDARTSAELWRFLPKAFKSYFNIRDPQAIQDRAGTELPLEKIYSKWPV